MAAGGIGQASLQKHFARGRLTVMDEQVRVAVELTVLCTPFGHQKLTSVPSLAGVRWGDLAYINGNRGGTLAVEAGE